MRYITLIFFSCILFCSCEKKELPVPKRNVVIRPGGISMPGERIEMQVEMGSDYRNQIWFSFNDSKVVYTNNKTDWDLSFECSVAGSRIMLNGAKAMRAYKTNFETLAEVTDTVGLGIHGKADVPSGNADSTAIGNWVQRNRVYVINRGYNEKGQLQGFYKLKISSVNAVEFTFEYANIHNNLVYKDTVTKNTDYNFRAYSFTTHQSCENIEPKKSAYDLCFTQYTHWFSEPPQYYLVAGVLTNSYKTRVITLTDKHFADITLNDTLNRFFSSKRDAIGYDWKEFNLDNNLYTVNQNTCYLISDNRGYFYKLHFLDFVNKSGVKGYPTFEFQKL